MKNSYVIKHFKCPRAYLRSEVKQWWKDMHKNTGASAWLNFIVIFNLPRCWFSRANYSLAFYFCFTERDPSSARPLSLIPLGTDTRPPTVCDGNFRSVLHPQVFFPVRTSHGSNQAGRPLFKTLSKPADGTEYSVEKAARVFCKQFKSFRELVCVWMYVRLS